MQTKRLRLSRPHPAQQQVIDEAKRFNVLVAGRRFGKSRLGIERCAVPALEGKPVGWFAPTYKNLAEIWREIVETFAPVTVAKSEQEHRLQLIGGGVIEMWSLDSPETVRGRYYARAILDECAIVRDLQAIWYNIIRPTLIDTKGDAYFLSTPKGRNDFAAFYALGEDAANTEWACWRFPTSANPHLPASEIDDMRRTMPARAFEQEIEARFIDEVSGALWKYGLIDDYRVSTAPPLVRIVVAIDPAVTAKADSDETGIIACGLDERGHTYVLADASGTYSPLAWAQKAVAQYDTLRADMIVAEVNNGGDLVEANLRAIRATAPYTAVHASRGKVTRAEPVAALYEQGRVHHVGTFPDLEVQMTTWSPVDDRTSPDRVDALVWALTELVLQDEAVETVVYYEEDYSINAP